MPQCAIGHGARTAAFACSNASRREACGCGTYSGGGGFWSRLQDFAALGMPKGWKSFPADHPFLGIQHDGVRYNGPLLEQHA